MPGEHRRPLGGAGLEELDDPRKAVGDVLADDAAGVEGPHRELGARLADGLRGDHADRLAELDQPPGRERLAVAGRMHTPWVDSQVSTERTRTRSSDGSSRSGLDLVVVEDGARLEHGAVGEGDRLDQDPAVEAGLQVVAVAGLVRGDLLDPDAAVWSRSRRSG